MTVAQGFDPLPSLQATTSVSVVDSADAVGEAAVLGILVATSGDAPADLGIERSGLEANAFTGEVGQALLVPRASGLPVVAVGVGDPADLDVTALRNAAAAFANGVSAHGSLAIALPDTAGMTAAAAAQAVVEGVLLSRYEYAALKSKAVREPIAELFLITAQTSAEEARAGADRGTTYSRVTSMARDLANSPPAHLTATRMAEAAQTVGADTGLDVEVFDKDALVELGCGGLLGVNKGSSEPPRMIKLTYRPADAAPDAPRLTFVGKGIMYDSGGISLKPADGTHATMKNDMTGAGDVLSAMSALRELACPTVVTGYLMCTDNMPSGTALGMGDVLTIRGGKTVEVLNTDAEGRLVMSDALVLATEEGADAVVDIATLTGASMRALGTEIATVNGNHQGLIEQIKVAAESTDEPVWQLPLAKRYLPQIASDIADINNLGGPNGGAITAALFLAEFVGDTPWAHLDIAGTAQAEAAQAWRPKGCTGFGARLLVDLAMSFSKP
ncbi:putative cytosol aminopeptidase [metagenome]|uniref:leucyl aminopeptidase n=1 Tax=metagenome TaxID=256318 RepID=A0A2P2C6E9_9ZZZZ